MVGGRLIFAQLCQAQHRSALSRHSPIASRSLHGGQKFYGSTGAPDLLKGRFFVRFAQRKEDCAFPCFQKASHRLGSSFRICSW